MNLFYFGMNDELNVLDQLIYLKHFGIIFKFNFIHKILIIKIRKDKVKMEKKNRKKQILIKLIKN